MTFTRASLFLAVSSLSLACGAKLPGGMSIPGGGAAAAASKVASGDDGPAAVVTGPAAGSASSSADDSGSIDMSQPDRPVKKELVAYYQKQDHKALFALLEGRRDDIYEKVKADIGRDLLWQSGNPDPAWITDWKTRDWSYASGNAEALVQGAFNRTWEAACKAEFDQAWAAHGKLAAQFQPELAAVDKEPNHYARMAGYVALAKKFEDAARAAGLDARKDPFGPSGFRITIARHAVAYHQGSRAAYTSFPWSAFPLADDLADDGRELTGDVAFERQAYCGAAARGGGLGITRYTLAVAGKATVSPTVWGDEDAIAAKVKALTEASKKALTTPSGVRLPLITSLGGLTFDEREPKLAALEDGTIDTVTPAGAGVTVTIVRKSAETYSYACKETNKVDHIDDDGRIVYRSNCKYGDKTYTLTAKVTFAELPPGLSLAKGDSISFTADVNKDDSKKVKDTAAKVDWVRTMDLTGRLVTAVKRGGKSLPL